MRDSSAADDCHVPQLGAPIEEGWDDTREGHDAASAAVLSARLHSVVLERVLPRLALIHQAWKAGAAENLPTTEDIESFGAAILETDSTAAHQLFQQMRERGLTVDVLFETLLAPTARRLGELWFEDLCDFVDVTVGVNRLRIMLEMYANAPSQIGDPRRRALLVSTPDEAHLFGLDMVANFLRASGWDTALEVGRSAGENAETVASSWFAVAGFTISKEEHLSAAARAIDAIRRASVNTKIAVIVGGWALRGRPDLVARIGGDAAAEDGPSAALLAQKLYIGQGAKLWARG
jgi:methanogenic corrinoid protein MtbC1